MRGMQNLKGLGEMSRKGRKRFLEWENRGRLADPTRQDNGPAQARPLNPPARANPMANPHASSPPNAAERRRVLVAADDEARRAYLALRTPAAERVWEVLEADCFDRARFVLQMDHCDALLLDASLFRPNDDAWSWLLSQH